MACSAADTYTDLSVSIVRQSAHAIAGGLFSAPLFRGTIILTTGSTRQIREDQLMDIQTNPAASMTAPFAERYDNFIGGKWVAPKEDQEIKPNKSII